MCLFCEIACKKIPSNIVYEDDFILAFKDINPQAKIHVLIIPKNHIESIDNVTSENSNIISHIFEIIPKIAKSLEIKNGYRIISNCGKDGCQSVKHLHFHLLGGQQLPERII